MFSAVRLAPVKLPGTLLMGLLFGWWYVRLRSIGPGVFGHLTAVLTILWFPELGENAVPEFTWVEPVAAAVGAVMLPGAILMLHRKFQREA